MLSGIQSVVLKNLAFFRFFTSNLAVVGIGVVSGLLMFKSVQPELLGIYSIFTVVEVYGSFGRLGIINGLGRLLPYLFGKGQFEQATQLASAALSFTIISNICTIVIASLFVFSLYPSILADHNYLLSFLTIFFRFVISGYSSFLSVTFRTQKNFEDLTTINYILVIVRVASILFVYLYGFYGLLLRDFTLALLEMIALHYYRPISVKPAFNLALLKELFTVGFPLFIASFIRSFGDTLPRLFIINFGTVKELGLFSPINILLAVSLTLPQSLGSYLYPKMLHDLGGENDKKLLWDKTISSYQLSFLSSIPIAICVLLLIKPFSHYFPSYAQSVQYMYYVVIAIFFSGYKCGNNIISILGSKVQLLFSASVNILVQILFLTVFYHLVEDIILVSVFSVLATYIFMYAGTFYFASKLLKQA